MDLGLKGKKALVMGSTRGMGLGIAARLAAEGASVAVCGRNLVDAQDAASGIDGSRAYALDLSDVKSVDALIEAVRADFGVIAPRPWSPVLPESRGDRCDWTLDRPDAGRFRS